MDQLPSVTANPIAPRGYHEGKVDREGRIKLPARFVEYVDETKSRKDLFMTEFMGKARIYTNGSWNRLLSKLDDRPKEREDFRDACEEIGEDITIDPQERITIPQKLRTKLELGNKKVKMRFNNDIITFTVVTDEEPGKDELERKAQEKRTTESRLLEMDPALR